MTSVAEKSVARAQKCPSNVLGVAFGYGSSLGDFSSLNSGLFEHFECFQPFTRPGALVWTLKVAFLSFSHFECLDLSLLAVKAFIYPSDTLESFNFRIF